MTRHRAPRGAQDQPARGRHGTAADTVPFAIPTGAARGRSRHRSPGRSALRRGALTAGIAGGALAVGGIAVPMLSAAGPDAAPTADLALSTQSAPAASSAAVTPAAAAAAPVGAASGDLVKAVDRQRRAEADRAAARQAEAERAEADRAAAAERERAKSVDCGVSDTYDGVAGNVQTVGNALECLFPGRTIYGTGSRGNASDHPGGYALDIMNKGGKASGEAVARCVVDNADALGVKYTIFNRRIDTGSGWERMEDRGGVTANHEDHVHISFERGATPDVAALRGCGSGSGGSGKA